MSELDDVKAFSSATNWRQTRAEAELLHDASTEQFVLFIELRNAVRAMRNTRQEYLSRASCTNRSNKAATQQAKIAADTDQQRLGDALFRLEMAFRGAR